MTLLQNFFSPARVAIVGASGGIGDALVSQLSEDSAIETIYAFTRSPGRIAHPKVTCEFLDVESEASISEAAGLTAAGGPLDLVVVASGILHQGKNIQPEKTMAALDAAQMAKVFAVNAIGPALIAKHFLPLMRKETRTVFAALSARVGSIGDNRLGGWLSYRASKSALNMAIKTLSVEQARKNPESILVGIHPGTVDTGLSSPFTEGMSPDKLFSPARAATQLLAVIDGLPGDASGGFYAWDGTSIPF